jgi:hypothetical protein
MAINGRSRNWKKVFTNNWKRMRLRIPGAGVIGR